MQIIATIKDGTANLALTAGSSSSVLPIKGADELAQDLEQFLTNPDAKAIDRHYLIVPDATGLCIQTDRGKFNIPWRHIMIMTVVNGLRTT